MQKNDLGPSITFSITVDVKALEKICVYICNTDTTAYSRYFLGIVGSNSLFGNWNPEKGVICKFEQSICKGVEVWVFSIAKSNLPPEMQFRFFVAEWRISQDNEVFRKNLVVLAWESRIKSRFLKITDFSGENSTISFKFGQYDTGLFLQRGYLLSHSELRIRLSGLALKLSKNAIPGLSSSTQDLTKLCGRRVYVTCKQSLVEENGVLNALEGEAAIYPNANASTSNFSLNSSHLIDSLEQSIAAEIRSQLIERPDLNFHKSTQSRSIVPPNGAFTTFPPRVGLTSELTVSPISSRNSTCPPTPRSLSPTLSHRGEPPVFVSVLTKNRCSRRLGEHTGCWGTLYSAGDDVTFYVETENLDDVVVELEFYVEVPNKADVAPPKESDLPPVKFLGSAFFGPFNGLWGQKGAQLLSRRRTLMGDVRISYMAICPIVNGPQPSLEVSYKHYWSSRGALEIGHRGMGTYFMSSDHPEFERPAPIRENTLRSFETAVNHGADFVEMDVQLTKDFKVVVYHDFETVITPRKKKRNELQNLSVAVKDLPYSALRELRLQHSSVLSKPQTDEEMNDEDLDPMELQLFPLLRDCLQDIDPDVGFDIEIKYPLELKSGGSEMDNFFERNVYIDTILREVYQFSGDRRILFSCFDPDTCAMLQMKQVKYPVFQLGVETDFTDIRHKNFENLCYSSKANELLGVAVNSDEILRNPDMAAFARSLGLILLVWGSAANTAENMKRLKDLGVHGLIFDRMHEHKKCGTLSSFKSAKLSCSDLRFAHTTTNCNSSSASTGNQNSNSQLPFQQNILSDDDGCASDISLLYTPDDDILQSTVSAINVSVSQLKL